MKHSLFWAAVEAAAKAIRSGLGAVGALVDCGIPRQHAGEQWLTEKEAEEDVAEPQAEICHCGHAFAEHRVTAYGMTSAINCGGRKDYGDGMEECFCTRWFALAAIPADVQPFPGQKPHPRSPAAEVWEAPLSADYDDEAENVEPLHHLETCGCGCGQQVWKAGPPQAPAVSATDSAVEDPSVGVPPAPTEADSLTHLAQCLRDAVGDHYDFACRPYDQFPFWHDDHLIDAFDWEGATTAFLEDVVRQLIDEK